MDRPSPRPAEMVPDPAGARAKAPRRQRAPRSARTEGGATADHSAEISRLVRELAVLREEQAKLQATIEELGQLVEERTRRAQQLIGERAQLEARLAERDQQVQQLNRELGAASVRARRVGAGVQPWLLRARAWLRPALGDAPARSHTAAPALPPAPLAPAQTPPVPPPLMPFFKDDLPRPLVGIAAFGLAGADLERVLDVALRYCSERGLRPLVLTDSDALEVFRGRRLVFEYLPPRGVREGWPAGLDIDLYLQRRLALIRRKWQPVRVIAFGPAAAEVARLWAASPFEDEGIAQLLGRGAEPAP